MKTDWPARVSPLHRHRRLRHHRIAGPPATPRERPLGTEKTGSFNFARANEPSLPDCQLSHGTHILHMRTGYRQWSKVNPSLYSICFAGDACTGVRCELCLKSQLQPCIQPLPGHVQELECGPLSHATVPLQTCFCLPSRLFAAVVTPLDAERWDEALRCHPDRAFTSYISQDIMSGFHIGFRFGVVACRSTSANMPSASQCVCWGGGKLTSFCQ